MVQKHAMLAILMATVALAACDRPANPPQSSTVVVPAPVPGPPGAPGKPGDAGSAAVIVVPPAPAASEAK
jgi:hypothetical protein